MYQINRVINNLGGIICQGLYLLISYEVNLSFEHRNVFEFFIGMIITTLLMNLIEFLLYKIAYIKTGELSSYNHYDSSERKVVHWIIRVCLIAIVYFVSLTPLCNIILTPIVRECTQVVINYFNNLTTNTSNSIIEVLTN